MQNSNNRFNKPRNSGKFSSKNKIEKRKTESDRYSDNENKTDRPFKGGFDKKNKFSGADKSNKPFRKKGFDRAEKSGFGDREKSFNKKNDGDVKFERPFKKHKGGEKSNFREKDKFRKDKREFSKDDHHSEKSYKHRDSDSDNKEYSHDKKKGYSSDSYKKHRDKKDFDRGYKKNYKKHGDDKKPKTEKHQVSKHTDGSIRLNKYLANAGVSSRREADELIKAGAVSVNGKIITEMGFRVMPTDKINYGGETLRNEKKVYLILNKPKDYLTTTDDPRERKTVMELIEGACRERVYPVGRLDRNTTGLLLFTNDGEMATKLMHPKHGIKKLYHVLLNKNMKPADYGQLHEGVELEDGFIKPDNLSFTGEGKKELGIEIHSGKNRIVRRIFEHLGYEVVKLDRVSFAGLTKKDLPRGKWRFLNPKEVGFLKMIG